MLLVCTSAHCIAGLTVITADLYSPKESSPPPLFVPCDWPTQFLLPLPLASTVSPSLPAGPPGVVAWLHQKLIYLSKALDVYCSTFLGVSHLRWHWHFQTHTHTLKHTLKHTERQRTTHNAPRRYPASPATPADTDADTTKRSTGITFTLDAGLGDRPTHHRLRKQQERGGSNTVGSWMLHPHQMCQLGSN